MDWRLKLPLENILIILLQVLVSLSIFLRHNILNFELSYNVTFSFSNLHNDEDEEDFIGYIYARHIIYNYNKYYIVYSSYKKFARHMVLFLIY